MTDMRLPSPVSCARSPQTNETPGTSNASAYRFRFALPTATATLGLPIGKHLVLRFKDADGRPVSRQYTPITSDSERGYFDLLVKLYPAGKMSQYLSALPLGSQVEVRGPMGMLEYKGRGQIALNKGGWKTRQVSKIGMIAGGSGLTPMYQIATHILRDKHDATELSFIFANVTETDILLRSELDGLAAAHSRFTLFYTINPPREGEKVPEHWKGGVGFVSTAMIGKYMPPPSDGDSCMVMVCGPKPMVDAMTKLLKEMGYADEQIWVF